LKRREQSSPLRLAQNPSPSALRSAVRVSTTARKESPMDAVEMLRLFEAHREAEAARDIDAILETFVRDGSPRDGAARGAK
jgi:hypothetical protein